MPSLPIMLLALQAATPSATPEGFSILANCPAARGSEVLVCGTRESESQRLPLPDERARPDGPRKATGDPRAALDAGDPGGCALRDCQVGVDVMGMGVAAIRPAGKLIDPDSCCERPGKGTSAGLLLQDTVGGIEHAFAGKADKAPRVTIALNEPPPPAIGRVSP